MHLKRLEIQGFKSFAQKTVLEFEPGITAIVGPNGSGKSNVADSVRWVLGEQSAKQLRGKKSDDVVFAGSDKRARGGFAEVVATFDNSDHRIPVDTSEVSIGRRVDRTGESEYLINGAKVRLLDIVELVLKSNIGTSRYTVIGQGTIDQLILAGPGEIKSLLDEASGVKVYHTRRDKTLKRLEQTAQNLMRAEDVVGELEPRLRSLRRQAKRMEAREGLEVELRLLLRERLGSQYFELSEKATQLSEQIAHKEAARAEVELRIRELQSQLERGAESAGFEAAQTAAIRRDLLALQEKKNRLFEQRSILQGKLASAQSGTKGDPRALQVLAGQLESKLQTLSGQLIQAQEELDSGTVEEGELTAEKQKIERTLEELYALLAHPNTINKEEYSVVLNDLHAAVEGFLSRLGAVTDPDSVHSLAIGFRHDYEVLRQRANRLFEQGGATSARSQEELQHLHKAKSHVEQRLAGLLARRASAETTVRFLEQQQRLLSQEHLDVRLELQKASSVGTDSYIEGLTVEAGKLEQELSGLQEAMRAHEEKLASFESNDQQRRQSFTNLERQIRALQERVSSLRDEQGFVSVEKARFDTQREAVMAEIVTVFGPDLSAEVMRTAARSNRADIEEVIAKLKHQLELIGGVDEMTMQEYRETEERFTRLSEQIADLRRSMEDLRQIMDELDEHIKSKFNEAFHKVNERFENYFRMLFNGGRAQLVLVRAHEDVVDELGTDSQGDEVGSLRPEEQIVQKYEASSSVISGVDIKATPPGKKLANIQALSGGERALTSIALLCALLACFPSPFVVLDEVDAALDEANTIRFGQILGTLAHQTQFVTITHNRETMAQSSMLYGVTMGDDSVSKILSLKFDQAAAFAK